MKIRIGTRGSKLALWQAQLVEKLLEEASFQPELQIISTKGDEIQDVPLSSIGSVGLFTKALDLSLLERGTDIAVHSAKDMPSILPEELEIIAFLKREDPRDVLVALSEEVNLENFSRKWVIGTSSMRRTALLKHYFKHVEVKAIRGNVDSRIAKLESGEYDAVLLAYAGVKRMGFSSKVVQKLNLSAFTPAVGQGAIAVVSRKDFAAKKQVNTTLNHKETEVAVRCERAFLKEIEGGCNTPVFGFANVIGDRVILQAGIASEDGAIVLREKREDLVHNAEHVGKELAKTIIEQYKQ